MLKLGFFLKSGNQHAKNERLSSKHWTNCLDWEMAEAMHEIILQSIVEAIRGCHFIYVSIDEVTTINNQ